MADIAQLGFDIDTAPLTRTNTDLRNLAANAARAERAVTNLSTRVNAANQNLASMVTSASRSMQNATQAVTSSVANVASAQRQLVTAANNAASAVASVQRNVVTATNSAASAVAATAQASTRASNAASAAANNAANSNFRLASSVREVGGVYTKLIAILSAGILARAADDGIRLSNSLRLVGLSSAEAAEVQERLFKIANDNGASIDLLVNVYRRASIAAKDLGASQEEVLAIVKGSAEALRIQGTDMNRATGSLLQLSQALGSGTVRAEEFNSIMEGAFPIAQAAARGMGLVGDSVARLRTMVINGQITSKQFFEALKTGFKTTAEEAADLSLTFGGALSVLNNGIVKFVQDIDNSTGVVSKLIGLIQDLGVWLGSLGKNPYVIEGIRVAFSKLEEVVRSTYKEVVGLLGLFAQVWEWGKQFAREQNVSGARNLLDASGDRIKSIQERIADNQRKLQTAEADMSRATIKTGPASQRAWALTVEISKDNDLLQAELKAREDLERKALNYAVGDSEIPGFAMPQVTGRDLLGKPDLTTKPVGGADDATGKINKQAASLAKAYDKIIINAQQFIATQKRQEDALGTSEEAMLKFKHQQELLNQAQDRGIKLTEAQRAQLLGLGAAMGEAEAKFNASKFMHEAQQSSEEFIQSQQMELEVLGMSAEAAFAYRKEHELLNEARRQGITLSDAQKTQIKESAAAMAAAKSEVDSYSDSLEFAKEIFSDVFSDMKDALYQGKNLWVSFGDAAMGVLSKIADKLLNMAINGLFEEAFGGRGSASGTSSGTGGMGGIFDSLGGMWNQTQDWFSGMFSSGSGGGYNDIGELIAAKGIGGSGIGMGNILGAAGGVAAGVGQLASGGGSTGSTIAGIGSLVGAAVSMIPGIGQIAGPLIMLASNLLGGLLGEQYQLPPLTGDNANFTANRDGVYGLTYSSTQNGGVSNAGKSTWLVDALNEWSQRAANGTALDPGKMWGFNIWNNQREGTSASYLLDPMGNSTFMSEGDGDQSAAYERTIAQAFRNTILSGGIPGASSNLKTAFQNSNVNSIDHVNTVLDAIEKFDAAFAKFGKTTTDAESAIEQINESFDELNTIATTFGLDATAVAAERKRQQLEQAQSFIDPIQDALLGYSDPLQVALNQLEREKQDAIANNEAYVRLVEGYSDQASAIEELYYKKRNEIIENYNKQSLSALDALIAQYMPGGGLAGESATAKLAGLQAAYDTARNEAFASPLDQDKMAAFIEANAALGEFAKDFFSNDLNYIKQRDQLLADAQAIRALVEAGVDEEESPTQQGSSNTQFMQLMTTVNSLTSQLTLVMDQNAKLTAKLDRFLGNRGS